MVLSQKQKLNVIELKPHTHGNQIFGKEARNIHWENDRTFKKW